jgi:hypothetical protein
MPGKAGDKLNRLGGSLLEAAVWKRGFFAAKKFETVEELVSSAAKGEEARGYVEAYLQLGHRPDRRRTVAQVHDAMMRQTKEHWLNRTLSGLWLLYRAERGMWKQDGGPEPAEFTCATRAQRQQLRGAMMPSVRRPSLWKRGAKMRRQAEESIQGVVYMHWVDNYNKQRYARNPNEDRNKCVNATVFALLPVQVVDRAAWDGWPTAGDLYDALPGFATAMHRHHSEMNDRVRTLMLQNMKYDEVRVPCDVRRFDVVTMPWQPLRILDADIKSTEGLALALKAVLELRDRSQGLCCMLMDVNIFWRVLKMCYAFQNLQYNLLDGLKECVLVLGVWHAYAHCLKKVYERFMPWWAALEHPGFMDYPEDTVIYTRPRIILIEHLVMGLFLAGDKITEAIRRAEQQMRQRGEIVSSTMSQLRGLQLLVTEYCPALVEMGISVRQCFWRTQDGDTGDVARTVLRDAIVLLQALHGTGNTEYIRNLSLMDLLWGRVHSALPAACFVEECLESSLSTLARRLGTDPRAGQVEDFSNTYSHRMPRHGELQWEGMGGGGPGVHSGWAVYVCGLPPLHAGHSVPPPPLAGRGCRRRTWCGLG